MPSTRQRVTEEIIFSYISFNYPSFFIQCNVELLINSSIPWIMEPGGFPNIRILSLINSVVRIKIFRIDSHIALPPTPRPS